MIPEGWTIKKTGELCDSIVPGRNKPRNWGGDIPWIRTEDLNGKLFIKSEDIEFKLMKEEIKRAGGKLAPKNSVIMTCVGNLGIVSIISQPSSMNQQLHAFVCKKEIIPLFLAYSLNFNKNKIINLAQKTSVLYLNKDGCESIPLLLPPLKEQEKISSILINLDNLVFYTQKIINNLHTLKKGLMQRLFMEGIGHTEFKETRVGKIPKEWDLTTLENLAEIKAGGNAPQGNGYFDNGKYPFVRVQHFSGEKLYVEKWDLINDKAVEDYNLKLFPKNAIIFPKSGATINLEKRALLPQECYVVGHLCVVLSNVKSIDLYYLFYYLKNLRLARFSAGSTLPYLNLKYISKIKIPLPSILEQKKIGNFLFDIDKTIENEQNYLNNLKNTKKGLMQDLLTSKKRVKIN